MALRTLEYALAVRRHLGRFPIQVVLYAGFAPMNMPAALVESELSFRYRLVDMRVIESEPLLASPGVADNVIAVLSRVTDQQAAVRRILDRIVESEPGKRDEAIRALEILAGLRRLGSFVKQEISMPILDDILDHDYYGPKLREGIARGEEPGRVLGREEGHLTGHLEGRIAGRLEGERHLILRQIEKRFGQVPAWVASRLDSMSRVEIEAIALRLFDAGKIEDLFSPN